MTDIVNLTGDHWARRAVADAWESAGRPPINSAGRLYAEQRELYIGYAERRPGFAPADNPDDESQQLAHCRFVALDIDPTPARVAALGRAGLVRPYWYEPWHWQLPGDVRRFPIVRNLPIPTLEEEMGFYCSPDGGKTIFWWSAANQRVRKLTDAEAAVIRGGSSIPELKVKKVGAGWLGQARRLG